MIPSALIASIILVRDADVHAQPASSTAYNEPMDDSFNDGCYDPKRTPSSIYKLIIRKLLLINAIALVKRFIWKRVGPTTRKYTANAIAA